jgi:hypothetical protein
MRESFTFFGRPARREQNPQNIVNEGKEVAVSRDGTGIPAPGSPRRAEVQ